MNTWKLSWHGIWTVTSFDLRQRVRSRRWIWALIAWFFVILAFTILIVLSVEFSFAEEGSTANPGVVAFGGVTYFTLGMSLLLAPTFTATAINGDRAEGTLALLQVSRLSAAEIALGKLLAAWSTAGLFLAVTVPFLIWSVVVGAIPIWQVLACYSVMFLEIAVICAIGLGWSAFISRTAASVVLTYLTIAAVTAMAPLVMGLTAQYTAADDQVRYWGLNGAAADEYYKAVEAYWAANPDGNGEGLPAAPIDQCSWSTQINKQYHLEKTWWLLVPNPFVIVADAAPLPDSARADLASYVGTSQDPLLSLQLGIRSLRVPPRTEIDECAQLYAQSPAYEVNWDANGNVVSVETQDGTPVPYTSPVTSNPIAVDQPIWPFGLGFTAILGAAFFWIAVRRLRTPYGQLPGGTRVA